MNRPGKATRSHGKPSDDDDETTGLGLPVSLKRQIESYAVMHHMTPTQVLAEGMKLLLKQEALQQGRMNRAKPKARPCNKPFDAEERQYLCGLDAVDECGVQKRGRRSGSHRTQTHRTVREPMAQASGEGKE